METGQAQIPSNKDYQKNALAAIVPQIMNAIGGGDRRTAALLEKQRVNNDARAEKMQERNFMRSIMSPASGEITSELIMQQASLFGVDPAKAMQMFMTFSKYRQEKQTTADKTSAVEFKQNAFNSDMKPREYLKQHGGSLSTGAWDDVHGGLPVVKDPVKSNYFVENKDKSITNLSLLPSEVVNFPGANRGRKIASPKNPKDTMGWVGQKDGSKKYQKLTTGTISHSTPKTDKTKDTNKEYARVMGQIDKVKNSGGIDELLLAGMSPEIKKQLMGADRSEYLNVLESYAAELKKKITFKDEDKPEGSKITHRFENGKLVEIK